MGEWWLGGGGTGQGNSYPNPNSNPYYVFNPNPIPSSGSNPTSRETHTHHFLFEHIPFAVEGNARQWVLPATGNRMAKHNKKRRGMQVEKWMCTEAQLGKDQLDCHFAWITECFKAYLNKEGNNLIISLYMFTALTDPSFDIANTHVMYGSTAHPKLQKKFVMKHLKVHQVHEY
jgi:hypothetical protein